MSNGQNRVQLEARWPKPGTPFHASPRAPSYWPTPAQTRLWPNLKRVHPISAAHPPFGYPISITPTRLWQGYSTSSPHAQAHTRTRHRVIAGRGGAFLRSTWSCVRQNFYLRCAVCMRCTFVEDVYLYVHVWMYMSYVRHAALLYHILRMYVDPPPNS